jgi:hypothetical protein
MKKLRKILKDFWNKYVITPINKKKLKQLEIDRVNNLKNHFENDFKVSVEKMKQVINSEPYKQTDFNYLNQKIIEGRKHILDNNLPVGSQMLEPDVIDNHNNNGGYTNKTISEVIGKDFENAANALNSSHQKEKLKNKLIWLRKG